MKFSKIFCILSVFFFTFLLPIFAFADDFFEVGKTYLFVPRIDEVLKGTVVLVTSQEVVFTDRYVLKASKAAKSNDEKAAQINRAAIAEYISSKNKHALLESIQLQNMPVSYSRSEMTAVKVDE